MVKNNVAYHVSFGENRESIKKNGLNPNKWKYRSNPGPSIVFVFSSIKGVEKYIKFWKYTFKNANEKEKNLIKILDVWKINVDGYKLYKDDSLLDAHYIENVIPPNKVKLFKTVNMESLQKENCILVTEAAIPIPSRVIFTRNKVTELGKKILMDILPETWESHKEAVKRAKEFVEKCHQTDYRSDSRIFKTKTYGNLLISFTQFYWYKGLSPEVTIISLNVNDSTVIEVYDFIVDSDIFAKEMSKKYHAKIKAKKFIPTSSDNTKEQKKFPRLVELGSWAKKFFASLPNIPDQSPGGMGNAMSFLSSETDNKRLFDYQFFEWNQFLEAEHFAKQYFSQGYDVYKGSNSIGKNSIMIYVLKNQKPGPLPFFKKKYFSNRGMEKQGTD